MENDYRYTSRPVRGYVLLPALVVAALVAASTARPQTAGGPIEVVAAENVWGSIAAQLGGDRVHVTSVIANPATDPHDYEPTSVDARTVAGARMVIVNGIGYDPWAPKLIAANPVAGRLVLTVGDVVGIKPGGNPHRWYSPPNVQQVISTISRDYAKLDPRSASYFRAQKTRFETRLAQYERLIATIRRRYHGVAVGASESIFAPLAQALGLRLVTPSSFLRAISEGADPTAADKTTVDRQIAKKQIEVWVFNGQNSTPDVARLTDAARRNGIPVTTITETLTPASATFEQWQSAQLKALEAALHQATGR
jgi:zinc/manganese transport system substrate-binding protein